MKNLHGFLNPECWKWALLLSTQKDSTACAKRANCECCVLSLASQTDTSLIDGDLQASARLGDIQANNKFPLLF
jgi:hypothetical protein